MRKVTLFVTLLSFSFLLLADEMKANTNKCKYNDANACHEVALQYYLLDMNPRKALPFFKKACDLGEGLACYTAGYLSYATTDDRTLLFYLDKGCKAKDDKSCKKLEQLKNK